MSNETQIDKLPLKKRILSGFVSGLFFALTIVVLNYFENNSFAILEALIGGSIFGLVMSFVFRHKITKKKT